MPAPAPTRRRGLALAAAAVPLLLVGRGRAAAAAGLPTVKVSKDPSCGCCAAWADRLRADGFPVEVAAAPDLARLKAALGVPPDLAGCHTAEVGGYVLEGHVPAAAIRALLAERPAATGLAVPGMPVGSPGMEVAGAEPEPFDVILFGPWGRRGFARFRGDRPV